MFSLFKKKLLLVVSTQEKRPDEGGNLSFPQFGESQTHSANHKVISSPIIFEQKGASSFKYLCRVTSASNQVIKFLRKRITTS